MPNQAQDFEGAVLDSSSTIYRSNFFWKCSLRCSLLSERNFSCRIKGVFFIESPFSVHLIVICVTSVYFQSVKFRTFQPVNMAYKLKNLRGQLPNGKSPRRYSFSGCSAVCERPSAQLSVRIKDIFGWSEQGYSDWSTLRYCSCCSWFIAVSAYNKKWDRQPLWGKSISFFCWGYFATAPFYNNPALQFGRNA